MKLLKRDFNAWLESKQDGDSVGKSGVPCLCPLATYIKDTHDRLNEVNVLHTELVYSHPNGRYYRKKLPIWAERFVRTVDEVVDYTNIVYAQDAKAVLDGVVVVTSEMKEADDLFEDWIFFGDE